MRLKHDLYLSRITLAAFAVQGYAWGAFAALVPPVKAGVGASDGAFGLVLLGAAAGALGAMAVAPAIDRRLDRWSLPVAGLLLVWAFVGLGCGVLFADWLNQFHLGGFPLGFWFAQQGSILVFVLLILVYALAMRALDRRHHEELEALRRDRREHGETGA